MTFNELHPIIKSWLDSDEFIHSIVSVTQAFQVPSSSILVSAVFSLALQETKPEEFRATLLSALPPDAQSDALVNDLVHASLLPIKIPLLESGIDLAVISPINEVSSATSATSANIAPDTSNNNSYSTKEAPPIDASPLMPSINPIVPINASPITTATTEKIPYSPSIMTEVAPPVTPPTLIAPNFAPELSSSQTTTPIAPFVIYEEKEIETASSTHKDGPLRPVFYSEKPATQESTPVANIEFNNLADNKEVGAHNIINLKDLPL